MHAGCGCGPCCWKLEQGPTRIYCHVSRIFVSEFSGKEFDRNTHLTISHLTSFPFSCCPLKFRLPTEQKNKIMIFSSIHHHHHHHRCIFLFHCTKTLIFHPFTILTYIGTRYYPNKHITSLVTRVDIILFKGN